MLKQANMFQNTNLDILGKERCAEIIICCHILRLSICWVGCPRHVASIISGNVLGSIYIKPKTRQILAYRMSGMNSNGLENCLINLTIAYMCFIKILCCYFSCLLFFLIILSFFHTFLRIKY